MLLYHSGTVLMPIFLFSRKPHGPFKGDQYECILLPLLVIVLFYLNSSGRNHTAQKTDLFA